MYFRRLNSIALLPLAFQGKIVFCDELSTSEKIRGNYENKIRFFAPPEKIFETFATLKEGEKIFMTYEDFFYSLTPYSFHPHPEEEKLKKYFENPPEILQLADINKDGKIDFPEFIFFLTILQLPEIEILNVFRKKGTSEHKMDKSVFSDEFTNLRKQTLIGRKQQNKTFIDARHTSADEEDFHQCNKSLIEVLFKEKAEISAEDFFTVKNELIEALWNYEFH